MNRKIDLFFTCLLVFHSVVSTAQVPGNSPYTRFGLGDIVSTGFDLNTAMGGTAVALRFGNYINYLNPASYSAQDTLSFLFEFGLTGSIRELHSGNSITSYNEINIGHLAIAFPLARWWGACIGITPYSKVGYNLLFKGTFQNTNDSYQISYRGSGGLNRFFIGSGIKIGDYFSAGGNLSYIFGSLEKSRSMLAIDGNTGGYDEGSAQSIFNTSLSMSGLMLSLGVQGFTRIGEKNRITGGITLESRSALNGSKEQLIYADYAIPSDTIINTTEGSVEVPLRFGAGLSYMYNNKLLVALDFITQDWNGSKFFGQSDSVTSSTSLRFGLQYIPVSISEVRRAPYWQRINLRMGGYYNNSYLKINGIQIRDYGMTFGIGIPWRNEKNLLTKSSFNLTYQFGQRGSFENSLIKETYHIFSVGFTLYDFWFVKPKYD